MAIRFQCKNCSAEFEVDDGLAGRHAKCTRCETSVVVPKETKVIGLQQGTSHSLSLSDLSPKEMVAELHRRGRSAVLFVFDRPSDGNYALNEVAGVSIACHGSEDMDEDQLRVAVQNIAKIAARQPKGKSESHEIQDSELYELKGDKLGISLHDFKRKYYRVVPGHDKTAPFCSDQQPNLAIESLLTEDWHTPANIVHCSKEFPFERIRGTVIPTVAGIAVTLLLYKFVDDHLYQISAYFDTRDFECIRRAVVEKYGEPDFEEKKPIHLAWSNGVSTINLIRGRISPKEFSMLHFSHDKLVETVRGRSPKRTADL